LSDAEIARDNAVAHAATIVGDAVQDTGNAAQDAAEDFSE